jgi:DNA-directed RNA polymerase specialized sigma24 family protein
MAANLAIDRLRHRDRRDKAMQSGLFDELRETPTPEHEASIAQEVEQLEKLVAQLPPKCRQAFLLYKIQGLEFAEVAARSRASNCGAVAQWTFALSR